MDLIQAKIYNEMCVITFNEICPNKVGKVVGFPTLSYNSNHENTIFLLPPPISHGVDLYYWATMIKDTHGPSLLDLLCKELGL